jgi:hypothetical protein
LAFAAISQPPDFLTRAVAGKPAAADDSNARCRSDGTNSCPGGPSATGFPGDPLGAAAGAAAGIRVASVAFELVVSGGGGPAAGVLKRALPAGIDLIPCLNHGASACMTSAGC